MLDQQRSDEGAVDQGEAPTHGVLADNPSKVPDKIFRALAITSAITIVLLVIFIGVFLAINAAPSLMHNKENFLFSSTWNTDPDNPPLAFGVASLVWVTVISSIIAMLIAVPIGIGVALFVTQYVPRKIGGPISSTISLLAAVPSIVYGLWGVTFLAPRLEGISEFLQKVLGWIPLFAEPESADPGTIFAASIVLSVMILPIVTSISRDVFDATPAPQREAALALGATRWEMIRLAVLPYGRSGVVSAAMLGLGRALGETIAVMIILSTPSGGQPFPWSVFSPGSTIASHIANNAGEFNTPKQTGAFIAAGLVLFLITFGVNAVARTIVERSTRRQEGKRVGSFGAKVGHYLGLPWRYLRKGLGALRGLVHLPNMLARKLTNYAAWVYVTGALLIACVPLVAILWSVFDKGRTLIFGRTWWTTSSYGLTEDEAGGGGYHAIMGTVIQAGITALIAIPIAILGAIFLVEYGRGTKVARVVSFMVDILTGVPSIVAALFMYAVWVSMFGFNRAGIVASFALVILMLPMVLRSTEEMLKLVPDELREASYALGVPKWKTILRVVLPTSMGGILTGVILGMARVMGETAPLLILVGYAAGINLDPTGGFQGALPTMINQERTSAEQASIDRTWAAALTLVVLVLVLTLLARLVNRFSQVKAK